MYVTSILFATVLFATVLKSSCTSETIFFKTNNSDHQCPVESCLTLQEFVSHDCRVESNTVLKFLPGNHTLFFNTSKHLLMLDVDNVTLTGVSGQQSSVIYCMSEFSVRAMIVQNLTISNLSFSGCGAPVPEGIMYDTTNVLNSGTLVLLYVTIVSILEICVHNSKGTGLLVVNGFDLTLNKTSFVGNTQNCAIVFENVRGPPEKLHVSCYIANSEFMFGRSNSMHCACAGGLDLIFLQTSYTVYVNIHNVALHNNTGTYGNFLMLTEGSCNYTMVQIEKIRSSSGLGDSESGFSLVDISGNSVIPCQRSLSFQFEYNVHILNSSFYASMYTTAVDISSHIAI